MGVTDELKEAIAEERRIYTAELGRLREALTKIAGKQQEALRIARSNGFVFDSIGNEPGNWQHLAFTYYNEICEIDMWAREALGVEVGATP